MKTSGNSKENIMISFKRNYKILVRYIWIECIRVRLGVKISNIYTYIYIYIYLYESNIFNLFLASNSIYIYEDIEKNTFRNRQIITRVYHIMHISHYYYLYPQSIINIHGLELFRWYTHYTSISYGKYMHYTYMY